MLGRWLNGSGRTYECCISTVVVINGLILWTCGLLDTIQDKTNATKGEEDKDSYDGSGETSSAGRGQAQVLQRERLTRDESTKTGCGVVEQSKKAWNQ